MEPASYQGGDEQASMASKPIKRNKACMLGMKETCIYGKEGRHGTQLLLGKQEMGGAQSPREQPLRAWECSSMGSMHVKKPR